jgi:hypothetical protein
MTYRRRSLRQDDCKAALEDMDEPHAACRLRWSKSGARAAKLKCEVACRWRASLPWLGRHLAAPRKQRNGAIALRSLRPSRESTCRTRSNAPPTIFRSWSACFESHLPVRAFRSTPCSVRGAAMSAASWRCATTPSRSIDRRRSPRSMSNGVPARVFANESALRLPTLRLTCPRARLMRSRDQHAEQAAQRTGTNG